MPCVGYGPQTQPAFSVRSSKFLLRHGRQQPEGMKAWTKKYLEWVKSLKSQVLFEQAALEATLSDYFHEAEHAAARIERLEKPLTSDRPFRHLLATAAKNNTDAYGMPFLKDGGIYHPDVVLTSKPNPGEEPCRLPTVGPEPR